MSIVDPSISHSGGSGFLKKLWLEAILDLTLSEFKLYFKLQN